MYVVSYDISSDKIRKKVSDILENYGLRIQYSVFECRITEPKMRKLYMELTKAVGMLEDGSIRIYFICENCSKKINVIGISANDVGYGDDPVIII